MSHSVLGQLNLSRGAYLWACFKVPIEGLDATVHGELNFLFGTEDDPKQPVLHLDTANLVLEGSEELTRRRGGHRRPAYCRVTGPGSISTRAHAASAPRSRSWSTSPPYGSANRNAGGDRTSDTPGPIGLKADATLRATFVSELRPVEYGFEMVEAELSIRLPPEVDERFRLPQLVVPLRMPLFWLRIELRRQLTLQPVFLAANGSQPPTGADFYPGLHNAERALGPMLHRVRRQVPDLRGQQTGAWRPRRKRSPSRTAPTSPTPSRSSSSRSWTQSTSGVAGRRGVRYGDGQGRLDRQPAAAQPAPPGP